MIANEEIALVQNIREWPSIAAVMQIMQIVVTVALSILTLYYG